MVLAVTSLSNSHKGGSVWLNSLGTNRSDTRKLHLTCTAQQNLTCMSSAQLTPRHRCRAKNTPTLSPVSRHPTVTKTAGRHLVPQHVVRGSSHSQIYVPLVSRKTMFQLQSMSRFVGTSRNSRRTFQQAGVAWKSRGRGTSRADVLCGAQAGEDQPAWRRRRRTFS